MNNLTLEQANYLAGFLDADGSILAQIVARKDYVYRFQIRVSVTYIQKMSRIHCLQKFKDEIGAGIVRDRKDGIAECSIVGHTNVLRFLKQVAPYLRNKQKQAHIVMQICEQLHLTLNHPQRFLTLCSLADDVAKENDSKKRVNTRETVERHLIDSGVIKKPSSSP